jgi:hypothetical protein
LKWPSEIPPPHPFFKGGNGGISADVLLKREMFKNMAAFFKKAKVLRKYNTLFGKAEKTKGRLDIGRPFGLKSTGSPPYFSR